MTPCEVVVGVIVGQNITLVYCKVLWYIVGLCERHREHYITISSQGSLAGEYTTAVSSLSILAGNYC